jgi:hypothetical protein
LQSVETNVPLIDTSRDLREKPQNRLENPKFTRRFLFFKTESTPQGLNDSLFNFKYTLRFLTMLDVKTLRLPKDLTIPVLVGVGDKDELFEIDKVKELYNAVPSDKKELVIWLDKTF